DVQAGGRGIAARSAARPIISIRGLGKMYGSFCALSGIDLDVAEGEVVVLLGPSGSGKSTLIRCINLLETYESGTVRVDDVAVQPGPNLAAVRSEVGMVFQSFNLFPHMTVLRNVALAPIRVRKLAPKAAEDRAMDLLNRVGIAEQAGRSPSAMAPAPTPSGGTGASPASTAWWRSATRRRNAASQPICTPSASRTGWTGASRWSAPPPRHATSRPSSRPPTI
ncbi:amino acid ABC transporter ATP-binding protein, partial [Azospirillum sp. B506]|uniref:amino acid ABC transporter ATP-binding protein n=1 Tax=Azospirillum sp. B506 TaxID=137721 RepID=UPI0027D8C3EA